MAIGADGRILPAPDRYLVVTSRLRERRHVLGLTQKQVVRRLASFGVTSTNKALSSLEHGAGIDVGKLPELAAALDCTVTYLLGLTDDPHSWQPDGTAESRTRPSGSRPSGLVRDHGPLEDYSLPDEDALTLQDDPDGNASLLTNESDPAAGGPDGRSEESQGEDPLASAGWILGPYVPQNRSVRGQPRP